MKNLCMRFRALFAIILLFSLMLTAGAVQANLLTNPGFEDGTTDWYIGGGSFDTVSTPVRSGSKAGRNFGRTVTWNSIRTRIEPIMTKGYTYRVALWARVSSGPDAVVLRMRTQVDGVNTTYTIASEDLLDSAWTLLEGTYTFPDYTGTLTDNFMYMSTATTGDIYWDDASITLLSPMAWSGESTDQIRPTTVSVSATVDAELSKAILVWDTQDHIPGTTNDWPEANRVVLTTQGSATVSGQLTSLTPDTEYTWRIYGENSETSGWTIPKTLTTLPPPAAYSMQISFTNLPGGATLTNFPALVKLNADNTGSYTGFLDTDNGYDLRFWTNSTFTGSELNYEIESFDSSGTSYIWVQVPRLSEGTTIWATWGDENYTNQQAYTTDGSVWSQDFGGVWHMTEADAADSTANGYDGTAVGGTTTVAGGMIGSGNEFDGDLDFDKIDFSTHGLLLEQNRSFSIWLKSDILLGTRGISLDPGIISGLSGGGVYNYITLKSSNRIAMEHSVDGGTALSVPMGSVFDTNTWNHLVVMVGSDNLASAYWNGQYCGKDADPFVDLDLNYLGLGYDNSSLDYAGAFDGVFDEMRFSTVPRGSNWVWACYMNQGPEHTSFVEYGSVSGDGALVWSDLDTTNITATSAWPTATVNTNSDVTVLVWDSVDHEPGTTNEWPSANRMSLGSNSAGVVTAQITGLSADSNVVWRIYGANAQTNGWSASNTFATALSSAQAPAFTNATALSFSAIQLGWDDNATTETAYLLYRSSGSGYQLVDTLPANTTSYQDDSVDASTTYTYRLAATNDTNGSGTDFADCESSSVTTPAITWAQATGGTVTNYYTDTNGVRWAAHIFTTVGANTLQITRSGKVEYLIVAAGGGGGSGKTNSGAGGGGAGGLLEGTTNVLAGAANVVVGNGGLGSTAFSSAGGNGGPSSAFGETAVGGGGGGSFESGAGNAGGSGGGGSNGTGGSGSQGNAGGDSTNVAKGGGGGGAGGAGGIATPGAGAGGGGLDRDITGTSVDYASGGDGGNSSYGIVDGADCAENTGDGGGGASTAGGHSSQAAGGNGGSGIVVVRYQLPPEGTIFRFR